MFALVEECYRCASNLATNSGLCDSCLQVLHPDKESDNQVKEPQDD